MSERKNGEPTWKGQEITDNAEIGGEEGGWISSEAWSTLSHSTAASEVLSTPAVLKPTGYIHSQKYGRAITQAISHRLPAALALVRAQVRSCGIYGRQSGTGDRFSPNTSFSPVNSHSTDCSTLIIYHPGLVQ
jgi:hypothetical protein